MNRRLIVGVAVVGLLCLGVGVVVAGPSGETNETTPEVALVQTDEVDRTVFRITVFENGDARWTIENRRDIALTAEDEIEDFNAFAERFRTEETETFESFQTRAERLTRQGTELTGREMNAVEFERDAHYSDLTQEGVVEMSFRWQGFAERDGEAVVVSDVFAGGFAILENQTLRFEHGGDLRFDRRGLESHPPDRSESGTADDPGAWIEWDGPYEFPSGEPNVTLLPVEDAETDTTEDTETDTTEDAETDTTEDAPDGDESNSDDDQKEQTDSDMMVPILVMVLFVASVGGGAIWYTIARAQEGTLTGAETADAPAETTPRDETTGVTLQQEKFLSDEDRVINLLEENDGRMRQVSIVEKTEWSKSKVSMLLSDMEADGQISKLRVGRENIISITGEEPDAAGSPFDDEESG